jgi:hypothetical protein
MPFPEASQAHAELMCGVHSEWNVRELKVLELSAGDLVMFVLRDDGPAFDGRQRHPEIPVSLLLPKDVDWPAWKTALWRWLENVKKELADDTSQAQRHIDPSCLKVALAAATENQSRNN